MERLRGSEGLDGFFQFNCEAVCAFRGVLSREADANGALGFGRGKSQGEQDGGGFRGSGRTSSTR